MMKTKLIGLFLLISINSNTYQFSHEKAYELQKHKASIQYRIEYRKVINEIKIREGFRATRYDDHGWPCIGYGQRTAFYPEVIPDSISEKQADLILKKSLIRHVKLCKRVNPTLKGFKLLKMAQNSYYFGIVRAKQLNKQI